MPCSRRSNPVVIWYSLPRGQFPFFWYAGGSGLVAVYSHVGLCDRGQAIWQHASSWVCVSEMQGLYSRLSTHSLGRRRELWGQLMSAWYVVGCWLWCVPIKYLYCYSWHVHTPRFSTMLSRGCGWRAWELYGEFLVTFYANIFCAGGQADLLYIDLHKKH